MGWQQPQRQMRPWSFELSIAGGDISTCFLFSSERGGRASAQIGMLTCFITLGLNLHILLLKKAPVSLYFLRMSLAVEILILNVFATFAIGSPYFSTFSTKFCLLYVSKCLPSSKFWYTFYGMSHNLFVSSLQSIIQLLLFDKFNLALQDYSICAKGVGFASFPAQDAETSFYQRQLSLRRFSLNLAPFLKLKMDWLWRYLAMRQTIGLVFYASKTICRCLFFKQGTGAQEKNNTKMDSKGGRLRLNGAAQGESQSMIEWFLVVSR